MARCRRGEYDRHLIFADKENGRTILWSNSKSCSFISIRPNVEFQ
jgi:hypothetical protein